MTDKDVCQTDRCASASHGGQAVTQNIVISEKLGKWFLASVIVGIVMLTAVGLMATRAELRAEQAMKSADYSANEFRMTQLWLQRANLACQTSQPMPAVPASLLQ